MDKAEFERRAAEMKARNLERRQFRDIPPPRSVFAPPLRSIPPAKVHVRDYFRNADFDKLDQPLARIRKLDRIGTDRDGLLDLNAAGLLISVSPDLFIRGVEAYDSVLRLAAQNGWLIKTDDPAHVKLVVCGELLEPSVAEKTDPIAGITVRPGERRPRRPTGALAISLSAGYEKVSIFDKRGTGIESKLEGLFAKAGVLASDVHARNERLAEMRRQEEIQQRRQNELRSRIEWLDRNMAAWRRAERIRAYVKVMADRLLERGPIDPNGDAAKWLAWAQRYADSIDPMCGSLQVTPQGFWE